MVRYCKYCEEDHHEGEFYSSQKGDRCKKYYKDSTNEHTNLRIKMDRSSVYSSRYRCPSKSVYAIMDGSEITYIGKSNDTPWRLFQCFDMKNDTAIHSFMKDLSPLHRKARYSWSVLYYGDHIDHQEKALIQIHQPKFNKILYKNYDA